MKRYVDGSYESQEEAFQAIQRLREQGYQPNDIILVANEHVVAQLPSGTEAEVKTDAALVEDTADDRSLWEKIKDAFTVDEFRAGMDGDAESIADDHPLYAYQEDLNRGNIVVMVTDSPEEYAGTGYDPNSSEVTDPFDETTTTGTGRSGTIARPADVNDLSAAKTSDILPGQDGDAFQTEGLVARDGDMEEQMDVPEVDHPYTPNPDLKNMAPDVVWDDETTLDRDGVTGVDASVTIDDERDPAVDDRPDIPPVPFDEQNPFVENRTPGTASGLDGNKEVDFPDDSEVDDVNRRP